MKSNSRQDCTTLIMTRKLRRRAWISFGIFFLDTDDTERIVTSLAYCDAGLCRKLKATDGRRLSRSFRVYLPV